MDNPLVNPLLVLACLVFLLNGHRTTTMVAAKTNNVHIVYLGEKQHDDPDLVTNSHHDLLAKIVGSKERASELMVYSYRHGFSGFAAKLTESQVQRIAELPGVVRVIPNSFYRLQTTRSWDFLGLSSQLPSNLLHKSKNGDGIIIGVLDTGLYPFSFLGRGTARGGASKARVAVYKVCWNNPSGLCAAADVMGAFDKAIHDGVDVLSVSIGSVIPSYSNVDERDVTAVGSFHAVAKGISVVCSAGNSGPLAQTVQNVAPWIVSVAANSIDRAFLTSITLGNNQTFLGEALFTRSDIGFTGLVYPESKGLDPTAFGVCEALSLNETKVDGKVVVCFTLMNPILAAISATAAVKEAGGVGLIVARQTFSALFPCPGDFPCVEVDYEVGTRIVNYIRYSRFPLVKLSPSKTVVGRPISAKVAYFSARGPNSVEPAILKPDITAPGVNILAATSPHDPSADGGYVLNSGTSVATPHVAGVVALLKALHPAWSPAAIKSALVTSAWRTGPSGLPIFVEGSPQKLADPFDFGGGIVNPTAAADPGLVYDMNTADYIHYLCAMHYNNSAISQLRGNITKCPVQKPSVLDVNLPSITIPSIRSTSITVTRTVTNVGAPNSIYRAVVEPPSGIVVSVEPEVLVFNFTVKKISFKVTVSTTHRFNTGYLFGILTWSDRVHFVRVPLSVRTEMFQPYSYVY